MLHRASILATLILFCCVHTSFAQRQPRLSDAATWRDVEAEMFEEINRLRRNPTAYAEEVLVPLKETLRRIPKREDEEYEASRILLSDDPIDYIDIPEGESTEDALAVIDEAIAALQNTPPLTELKRNEPLDAAARWFSDDFQRGGEQREPHVDSHGRKPAERISSFGATEQAIAQWDRFKTRVSESGKATVYLFQKEDDYFLVELQRRGGYQYRSVNGVFGKFVTEHGREMTLPQLDKPGFELEVTVEPKTRMLQHGEASIAYPLEVPGHGENVVWGPWSRQLAARGLVCWWILDPGIPERGHRQTLLIPELRYCGIGCTWSRRKGFVATFDATTDALSSLPQ